MFKRFTNACVRVVNRWLPDAFLFAVILTFVVYVAAMFATGMGPIKVLAAWGNSDGFWGLLAFSMQMALVLVLGSAMASAKPCKKVLRKAAGLCHNNMQAIVTTTMVSTVCCWLNWGFGLVAGALLAKEVAKRVPTVDYPLLIASAYSGFVIWHAGLSGSIPLTLVTGAKFGEVTYQAAITETVFHPMNIIMCAVVLLVSAVPAAWAAEPDADTAAPVQSLTASEATEMQQAAAAVTALTDSADYAAMSAADRKAAALEQLDDLVQQGLVAKGSIYADEENGMVSFSYSCGALGGVLVEDPDEENTPFALSELPAVDLHEMSNAPQGDLGSAMIYYAFDNTVNSSRYPYYSYMKGFWTAMGLHSRIDTSVTVSDLKRMNDYGLCSLSAHGSYYTYTSGFLFKQTRTEPVILLTEEADFY